LEEPVFHRAGRAFCRPPSSNDLSWAAVSRTARAALPHAFSGTLLGSLYLQLKESVMLRHALLLVSPALFIGCASLTAGDRVTGGTAEVRADATAPVPVAMELEHAATPSVGDEASSEDSLESAIGMDPLPSLGAPLAQETAEGLDTDRF